MPISALPVSTQPENLNEFSSLHLDQSVGVGVSRQLFSPNFDRRSLTSGSSSPGSASENSSSPDPPPQKSSRVAVSAAADEGLHTGGGIDVARFVLPAKGKDPHRWRMYKQAVASFWTPEEIDWSRDRTDFQQLSPDEQHLVKLVLAFFAGSDGIVVENLGQRFLKDVQDAESRCFYGFQIAMENIHAETYTLLLDTLIQDQAETDRLLYAAENVPSVRLKAEWALRWIESASAPFATRLLAFAVVEGVFFSSSFCVIFWLKSAHRGKLPALTFSNELISRDEGLHTDFACLKYSQLPLGERLSQIEAHQLVGEAVGVECEFVKEALPPSARLLGMNAGAMQEYVHFVANRLLMQLGYDPLPLGAEANASMGGGQKLPQNPFGFMEMISLQGKTNFFEKRVGEYQKANVLATEQVAAENGTAFSQAKFTMDADF